MQVQNSPEVIQKPLTNGGQKELKTAPKRDFHHLSMLTKSEMELTKSEMEARNTIFS